MEPIRPISDLDWHLTPEPVRQYILHLERTIFGLQKQLEEMGRRIDKLEVRTQKNSHNSSKPPSSDSPYTKKKRKQKKSKKAKGGQKGHPGHQQKLLEPSTTDCLDPQQCACGHKDFAGQEMTAFQTHQQIELPPIEMEVTHWVLNKCRCPKCGRTVKAALPAEARTGYGPRLSAFIAELSGTKAMSRNDVKSLCQSVLGFDISTGAIQNVIDRASAAIKPAYDTIGQIARSSECNYVDETSWYQNNDLNWLWAMVNKNIAFYRIDPNRSKRAFEDLVQDWSGILISDSYALYCSWTNSRQTCLAHLIRKAKGLSERKKLDLRRFGNIITASLQQLCHFAKSPPDPKKWNQFYSHLLFALSLYEDDQNDAGRLARQIVREIESLWTFLDHQGVEPTNNRAERALRFGVLWRKRSLGTHSEKGNRWVERILSFKETCRLRAKATFPLLVDLLRSYMTGNQPNLSWI